MRFSFFVTFFRKIFSKEFFIDSTIFKGSIRSSLKKTLKNINTKKTRKICVFIYPYFFLWIYWKLYFVLSLITDAAQNQVFFSLCKFNAIEAWLKKWFLLRWWKITLQKCNHSKNSISILGACNESLRKYVSVQKKAFWICYNCTMYVHAG